MREIAFQLLLFGVGPFLIAIGCGVGLIGGITETEALVPVYFLGLVFAITAIVM